MTLHVHIFRLWTRDPDLLDITRKSAASEGIAFAPSWEILRPALFARSAVAVLRQKAREYIGGDQPVNILAEAERIEANAWAHYVEAYTAEMRTSYRGQRGAWEALLRRPRVVLGCFCPDAAHCHRRLLAGILVKLGAVDEGELS